MNSTPLLILASGSPRRQEIMTVSGFKFQVFTRDLDESFPEDLPVREVAEFLSRKKNGFYRSFFANEVILTADTTVVLGDIILNKPADVQDAKRMIGLLSGNTHEVVTGVCISSETKTISFSEKTEVTFHPFTSGEIEYYIEIARPFDKAGAYGVQDWLGMVKVKELKGSFYNVMGLPVDRVYEVLKTDFGISFLP